MTRRIFKMVDGKLTEVGEAPPEFKPIAVKETIHGFVSRQLPRFYPYANKHLDRDIPGVGKKGAVVIEGGKREAKEIAARAAAAGERLQYDY